MNAYELWVKVGAGNWGARSVARRLQHRSDWSDMMLWCIAHEYVGETLWLLYADVFQKNLWQMGEYIRWQLRAEARRKGIQRSLSTLETLEYEF